jgi:hypothetical protein
MKQCRIKYIKIPQEKSKQGIKTNMVYLRRLFNEFHAISSLLSSKGGHEIFLLVANS